MCLACSWAPFFNRFLELAIEERLGVRETKALTIERDFFSPCQKAL